MSQVRDTVGKWFKISNSYILLDWHLYEWPLSKQVNSQKIIGTTKK